MDFCQVDFCQVFYSNPGKEGLRYGLQTVSLQVMSTDVFDVIFTVLKTRDVFSVDVCPDSTIVPMFFFLVCFILYSYAFFSLNLMVGFVHLMILFRK